MIVFPRPTPFLTAPKSYPRHAFAWLQAPVSQYRVPPRNALTASTLLMDETIESRKVFLNTGVIGPIQKIQGQLPSERKSGIPFPDSPPGRTIGRVIIVRQRVHVPDHVGSPG